MPIIPIQGPTAEHSQRIANIIGKAGGRAYLVGGCVRDALLDPEQPAKEADIEVFGVELTKLCDLLKDNDFECDLYGKSFQVIRLQDYQIDVSIPRRERKTGQKHTDFEIEADPHMSLQEAAGRRDFTINAIYAKLPDGIIEDPCDGMGDIKTKTLRHTTERFSEDPLRVLRAMQFSARFGFKVHPDTTALSRTLKQDDLSRERLYEEWKKLILKGNDFLLGLGFLKDCGWLRYYPELQALGSCQQDPHWHPEGNVWIHTLHCLNAFAKIRTGDEWEDLVVGLAVLCHDLGKPTTTVHEDGRVRSPGHAKEGVEITRKFLQRLTDHRQLIEEVPPLVRDHMTPLEFHRNGAGDSAIRRLARRVNRIDRLVRVATADKGGRPPMPWNPPLPEGEWLLRRAEELAVKDSAPEPILQGRQLIEIGHEPGPALGKILKAAFEAQLDGDFEDVEGGIDWVRSKMAG